MGTGVVVVRVRRRLGVGFQCGNCGKAKEKRDDCSHIIPSYSSPGEIAKIRGSLQGGTVLKFDWGYLSREIGRRIVLLASVDWR